jgi:hypothetical protein
MTQGSGDENILAQLSKKIDDQARFSRIVVVLCTLTIVGILYFIMTSEIQVLPDLVMTRIMGNMETLVVEWHLVETAVAKKRAAGQPITPILPAPK